MACGSSNGCGGNASVAGSPPPSTSVAGAAPCGPGFCDDKLRALPTSPAIELVGVPPGDQCLVRTAAGQGIWQRDPSRAGGPDFVGPLKQIAFEVTSKAASGKLALFTSIDDCADKSVVQLLPHDVAESSRGALMAIEREQCGDLTNLAVREVAPVENPGCVANVFFLAYTKELSHCGSAEFAQRKWLAYNELTIPGSQLQKISSPNFSDESQLRRVALKKVGDCFALVSLAAVTNGPTCDEIPDLSGDNPQFDRVLACNGGHQALIVPGNNKALRSRNGKWRLEDAGLTFHPLTVDQAFSPQFSAPGSRAVTLNEFPTLPSGGRIFAVFRGTAETNGDESDASFGLAVGAAINSFDPNVIVFAGYSTDRANEKFAPIEVTSANITLHAFTETNLGSSSAAACALIGYLY